MWNVRYKCNFWASGEVGFRVSSPDFVEDDSCVVRRDRNHPRVRER